MIWTSPANIERYCVDSGRPVRLIPGDRCLAHGARDVMCTTALRSPRCQHLHLSPNHTYPHCSECGQDLMQATPVTVPIQRACPTCESTVRAGGCGDRWHLPADTSSPDFNQPPPEGFWDNRETRRAKAKTTRRQR